MQKHSGGARGTRMTSRTARLCMASSISFASQRANAVERVWVSAESTRSADISSTHTELHEEYAVYDVATWLDPELR